MKQAVFDNPNKMHFKSKLQAFNYADHGRGRCMDDGLGADH